MDFKEELAAKAEVAATTKKSDGVKLTKNMSIVDMIKALEPEIKRALPSVLTPERFVRIHRHWHSVRRCHLLQP